MNEVLDLSKKRVIPIKHKIIFNIKMFNGWLKSMWKKKEVSELRVVDDAGVDIKTGKYVGDNSSLDRENK
jgi:hypothetical protein